MHRSSPFRIYPCPSLTKTRSTAATTFGLGEADYRDPRARIIKETADRFFEVSGRNPLLDIALELEKIALEDEFVVRPELYPNVDFYSGIIYQALEVLSDMLPVMFAIGRTVGWLAEWQELLEDPEQKIARPRQVYVARASGISSRSRSARSARSDSATTPVGLD